MHSFSAATQDWFDSAFATPTPAQAQAWEAIDRGEHTLVVAPTGSGKTLAAFLAALDRLATTPKPDDAQRRCRVLYVSPLKALAVDIERNLRSPLAGIRQAAGRLGLPEPDIEVAMRSGDTPADERRAFARRPADILITTPESLFLLLTSQAREALRGVDTVIVDEVHAVCASKRGAHLALSLERLDALLEQPAQRIGLSATVRPLDEVATFLAGGRDVTIVDPPAAKTIELQVVVPVEDMSALGEETGELHGSAAGAQQRSSIWPAVDEKVLDLIQAHRSTIVFANSRRLAERLTSRLNELAYERRTGQELDAEKPPAQLMAQSATGVATPESGPDGAPVPMIARAHHGSVSREQRLLIEDDLKSGRLPAVVATSSLELGIDMGAVDLVIQVEAPPSVASGLQRVGRAGHQVGASSRGVVFPKYRGDLVQCTVVAERMHAGAIEEIRYPRNPLDVLAQQIVAMVSMQDWDVMELADFLRRAAPFSSLPMSALESVLDMLSGRYPSDEFAELRPRLTWERVSGVLSGRRGAQRLAVTSGGTIPDRGLFGVFLVGEAGSPGRRVGELDEEMVYESRVGDVFCLGTSSWRVEDITHDQVVVSPAPGQPGRLPFWHGDALGRPLELGRAVGAFLRELATRSAATSRKRLAAIGLDEWAAGNVLAYIEEQKAATRHVPDDRTILVERFRDELGDWRLVVHSPFGAQVNAPWAQAIAARMRERYGVDVSAVHSDDGVVARLPDTESEPPSGELVVFDPEEIEGIVTAEVGGSALFAARFRECAARALLLPKRDPRRRSPLWQQRQRAAQLLQVAREYGSFPIVLETMRECLQDVFDLPGLVEIMRDVQSRAIKLVEVETPQASPFAQSLLFGYIGAFLYEGDSPLAERRAQALTLDTGLLAELLGQAELRELLDADSLHEVEAQLQRLTEERRAFDLDSTADLLRLLGDLRTDEAIERGATAAWLAELEEGRRALRVRIAGEERWIAIEDAGRVRDALGVALPVGVPEAFTEPVRDPLGDLVGRFARTHGPFQVGAAAGRLGIGVAVAEQTLQRLAGGGRVVAGEFRPGGSGAEWCDAEVLRTIRRRSLARLRGEIEPVDPAVLARFLPAWQRVGTYATRGYDGLLRAIEQLAGAVVPASALESLILPARIEGYSPALLDELMTAGEVRWCGAGSLPGRDGWVALAPAEIADALLPRPQELEGPLHQAIVGALRDDAALFFRSLSDRVYADSELGGSDDAELTAAIWDLVWAGQLTNDTLAPLRATLGAGRTSHSGRRRAPRGRYGRVGRPVLPSRTGPPVVAGRWSRLPAPLTEPTARAHALAETLLDRYGVLTRGAVMSEGAPGGFSAVYKVLRAFEEAGHARQGYFVGGLGAAQFASGGAVDRLRGFGAERRERQPALVLAATDPANPYGAALPWPERIEGQHRPGRKAGALVVLVDGELVLYVERGGRSLLSWSEDPELLQPAADALALTVRDGALGRIAVERADGAGVEGTALAQSLEAAGFRPTPRGLRLRG